MFLNPYCCGWFFHICAIQNCSKNKKDFKSLQHFLLCIPSPVSFQFPSPFLTAMGTASKASTWDVNVKFGNTWEQKGEPSSASCDEAHRTCKKIKAGTGLCVHIGEKKERDSSLAEGQLCLVLVPWCGVRRGSAPNVGGCCWRMPCVSACSGALGCFLGGHCDVVQVSGKGFPSQCSFWSPFRCRKSWLIPGGARLVCSCLRAQVRASCRLLEQSAELLLLRGYTAVCRQQLASK